MKKLLIFLFLLIACPAWGATITACASGCDQTTIQAALNAVTGNDTIQLSAETYTELLTFGATQSGKNITIQGVTGTVITHSSTTSTQQVIKIDSPYTSGTLTINDLTLQGVARLIRYYGIGNITFNNCTVGGSDYYIYSSSSTSGGSLTFNNCSLTHNNANTSITLYTNQNLTISGGTISTATGNFIVASGITIGDVTINGSTIDATGIAADYSLFYQTGAASINNYIFTNNIMTTGSGGGVRYNKTANYVNVSGNIITHNSATATTVALSIGLDGTTSTYPIQKILCNNNKIYFLGSARSHGILIGGGVLSGQAMHNLVVGADNLFVLKSTGVTMAYNTGIGTTGDLSCLYYRGSSYNNFYNNTCYMPNGHGVKIDTQNGVVSVGNRTENNIFYISKSTSYAIQDFTGTADGNADNNIFDYNIYYMSGGGSIASLNYGGTPPTVLATLANLQAGWAVYSSTYPTNDAHSLSSDPLFISATNFHLQPGSPARGAGVNVGLSNTNPPDIGAEPYVQYVPWR